LKLKEGIIYGPVNSRRLGSSLGINLLPWNYKLCTFNCLYCHYGWTMAHTREVLPYSADLPSVKQVREALGRCLVNVPLEALLKGKQASLNYLTFSGNGEPCMHPDFDQMVEVALETRDKCVPKAKVAILSNSTYLDDERVMAGLRRLDVRIMKLDAGSEETFRQLNRPCTTIHFQDVVENLKRLDDIILQSVFVERGRSGQMDRKAYLHKT